ncbi:MAG: hypothetical protein QG670_2847 [Thermoproteota archaeon]|nr:hypothetical protein [Thermoproteota archaeon]
MRKMTLLALLLLLSLPTALVIIKKRTNKEKVQSEVTDIPRWKFLKTSGTFASFEESQPLRNYQWASHSHQEQLESI